jgi:uncharacterized membrane protein
VRLELAVVQVLAARSVRRRSSATGCKSQSSGKQLFGAQRRRFKRVLSAALRRLLKLLFIVFLL